MCSPFIGGPLRPIFINHMFDLGFMDLPVFRVSMNCSIWSWWLTLRKHWSGAIKKSYPYMGCHFQYQCQVQLLRQSIQKVSKSVGVLWWESYCSNIMASYKLRKVVFSSDSVSQKRSYRRVSWQPPPTSLWKNNTNREMFRPRVLDFYRSEQCLIIQLKCLSKLS